MRKTKFLLAYFILPSLLILLGGCSPNKEKKCIESVKLAAQKAQSCIINRFEQDECDYVESRLKQEKLTCKLNDINEEYVRVAEDFGRSTVQGNPLKAPFLQMLGNSMSFEKWGLEYDQGLDFINFKSGECHNKFLSQEGAYAGFARVNINHPSSSLIKYRHEFFIQIPAGECFEPEVGFPVNIPKTILDQLIDNKEKLDRTTGNKIIYIVHVCNDFSQCTKDYETLAYLNNELVSLNNKIAIQSRIILPTPAERETLKNLISEKESLYKKLLP